LKTIVFFLSKKNEQKKVHKDDENIQLKKLFYLFKKGIKKKGVQ